MVYILDINYDIKHYPALDDELEDVLGQCSGGGTDFTTRDIDWWFNTKEERAQAKDKILQLQQKYQFKIVMNDCDLDE